jgi:NTE family protein
MKKVIKPPARAYVLAQKIATIGAAISLSATPFFSASAADTHQALKKENNELIGSIQSVNRDSSVLVPPANFQGKSESIFADKHPRLILVLGGGAGKSVTQIGVIRSLEKHHIPIDAVVGTSMGATIGALYCAGMPVDEMEKIFLDKSLHHTIMSGVIKGMIMHPIAKIAYLATGRPYIGASKATGYLKFLKEHLPATFAELKKPFAAVATNITDGRTCVFSSGNLPESVLASCSIPLMFKPVDIGGKLYVDGGLNANLPANIAQKLGDGVVVSVLCDNAIKPVPNETFKSKLGVIGRVVDIMIAAADHRQASESDVLIYPNVDFVPGVTKDPAVLKKAITAGEDAANQVISKIESKLAAHEKSVEKNAKQLTLSRANVVNTVDLH